MTRIGSLCSGYAGLDLAVREVIGGELAWVADNEPGAAALLACHYPSVKNLGDITAVNWDTVDQVEIMAGGFPCTDVSAAGARAGLKHGNRSGLWHEFVKAIAAQRPHLVVIENVLGLLTARGDEPTPEHLAAEAAEDTAMRLLGWLDNELNLAVRKGDAERARGCRKREARVKKAHKRAVARCQWHERRLIRAIGTVLADLAGLGYDAEWVVVTASAAGACHRRARVFILAFPASGRTLPGDPIAMIEDGAWLEARETLFGMTPFTGRIPASGRMAGGLIYAAEAGPTAAASVLLKTPTAQLAVNGGSQHPDKRRAGGHGPTLADQVEHELLPTPNATDGKGRSAPGDRVRGDGRTRGTDIDLPEAVAQLLPTPAARDGKGRDMPGREGGKSLPETLLPTPRATDGTKGGPNQRGSSGDMMLPSAVMSLLPTPTAGNFNDGEDLASWESRRQANLAKGINGNGQGTPLAIAAQRVMEMIFGAVDWGPYGAAIHRWEAVTGRQAPPPTVPGRTGERLNPALPEWMMGLPEGWITGVPGLSRNAMLKLAGNGVVRQQGALALRILLGRAGMAQAGWGRAA